LGHNRSDVRAGLSAEINVESCVISNNRNGIVAGSFDKSLVRVSNSTITNNTFHGLLGESSGIVLSRINNTVEGNRTDTAGVKPFAAR
jgi:hypothetical protein